MGHMANGAHGAWGTWELSSVISAERSSAAGTGAHSATSCASGIVACSCAWRPSWRVLAARQAGSQLHCPHQHSRISHRPGTGSLAHPAPSVFSSILAMHATALNYYVERSDYESYGNVGGAGGASESEASPGCLSSASSRAGTPPTGAACHRKVR